MIESVMLIKLCGKMVKEDDKADVVNKMDGESRNRTSVQWCVYKFCDA